MPPKTPILEQGISASRAGSSLKRPPQTARRGRPLPAPRAGPSRPAPSTAKAASGWPRDAADDSTASNTVRGNAKGKQRAGNTVEEQAESDRADDSMTSQAAAAAAAAEWCTPDRTLLNRTLHLYSISPLHFSGLPVSIRTISTPLFRFLRAELFQYVNLRLSDGLGFLEDANTLSNARDSTSGDLVPPARRRRTEMGKVGRVRIAFLKDKEFLDGFDERSSSASGLEDHQRPWIIEMELGMPVERNGAGSSKAPAAEAQSAELCHIIFLPGRSGSYLALDSHSYPLILTKAPSAALGSDQLLGASTNVGRLVLTHALDWLQKRFDCRISQGSGAMSIASMLRGAPLEALAEVVVRQTRLASGAGGARKRSAKQIQVDADVKPVEMSFALPAEVDDASGLDKGGKLDGPAPELATITLTVPWEICMQLVEGLSEDLALLPALNHYLAAHTSIPLDQLELVRIGVAGINLGAGLASVRLKMSAVPSAAVAAFQGETTKKRKADEKKASSEADKTRAGIVVGFLRDVAEGRR